MNTRFLRILTVVGCLLPVLGSSAATLYVDVNSPGSAAPYSTWATASTDIQDAINAANPGDLILVTNGVYQTGGEVISPYALTNRVAATIPVTIQSVNGPAVTAIMGYQVPGTTNGDSAVRCVYLGSGASLTGFTLTNGATRAAGDVNHERSGGGVWCDPASLFVSNCVIAGNVAASQGGGEYGGTLNNSILQSNFSGTIGGGAYNSVLNNCFLYGNTAGSAGGGMTAGTANNCTIVSNTVVGSGQGGGAAASALNNCIVYFNTSVNSNFPNSYSCSFNFSCTSPLPSGPGNIAIDPQITSVPQIATSSPCRGAGSPAYASGTDIYGDAWLNPPSMGCAEFVPGTVTGPLTAAIQASKVETRTNSPETFLAVISGRASGILWDFGDGIRVTNDFTVSHTWTTPGSYPVVMTAFNDSNPGGVSATNLVEVVLFDEIHFVSLTSTNPVSPFSSWATAATNIQNAIDVSSPFALVMVSNGVYATGGRTGPSSSLTNRMVVNKAITVESVNGPGVTAIQGYQVPGSPNGNSAIRGVYMTNGATLAGFTVMGGATLSSFSLGNDYLGGGVWCVSTNVLITNCVVSNNTAGYGGDGVYGGTLYNCTVVSNFDTGNTGEVGAAAYGSAMVNCLLTSNSTYGQGSTYGCTLTNCVISNNVGAGAYNSTLQGCTLTGNNGLAGGTYACILNNCILSSNVGGNPNTQAGCGGAYNSTLTNCTLIGNISLTYGGGASGGKLVNCQIISNVSGRIGFGGGGGGAYAATLDGCLVLGNYSTNNSDPGGGTLNCVLNNCTVVSNSGSYGGGTAGGTNNNCIILFNSTFYGVSNNFFGGTINYCDTTPLPTGGTGNISVNPQFSDTYHIPAFSPCRGAGSAAYTVRTDLDGNSWSNPPSIGCDEYTGLGPLTASIGANYTNVVGGFSLNFTGILDGSINSVVWNFGDGGTASNVFMATHAWQSPGNYTVTLTVYNAANPGGISASVSVLVVAQSVHYVSQASTNPVSPFSSWATAATNIQDAVDVVPVTAGEVILVSNGVYNFGGRVVPPFALTNRLAVTNPIIIQSVNGPAATVIQGGGSSSPNAVRCVWLGDHTVLAGFTLTAGGTLLGFPLGNNSSGDIVGGGVWCATTNSVVSNCIIVSNTAGGFATGAYGGSLFNCCVTGNTGGACVVSNLLYNCSVVGNQSLGTYNCMIYNSIVYSNAVDDSGSAFNFSCTSVQEPGLGNITNYPLFVNVTNGDFHLQSNSPCINAGNNAYVAGATDLDGNPRISGGTVDMGVYEFQNPASIISYAWLEQYGLATDGSADYVDSDHNGMNNWQKWVAGLNPTNAASVLQMLSPVPSGTNLVVTWQSVANISYFLQRSSSLAPGSFQTIVTNIAGLAGSTSYTDMNAPAPGPWYYRVGVP